MNGPDFSNISMLDLFRMEVETQLATLNDGLLTLETKLNPTQELASLMRAAHSIKGAARIVNVEAAIAVAHVMEDCFVAAQAGYLVLGANQIDVLLQASDLLLQIAQLVATNPDHGLSEQSIEVQTMVVALANILPINANLTPVHGLGDRNTTVAQLTETLLLSPDLPALVVEPTAALETPSVAAVAVAPPVPTPQPSGRESSSPMAERVVRVSADNLNRLMGLAGESLVEANWLQPFADSLLKLKARQAELTKLLDTLESTSTHLNQTQRTVDQVHLARQKANECHQMLTERLTDLEMFSRRSVNLADRLYREVISSHMRPFADGVQGYPRMMRDLARQLGKQVKLEIVGKSTQVDRDILEKLEAPLTHMLRNAIAHGIESPAERLALGKPAEGIVRLEATHRAGMLLIAVSDDGQGIDSARLRQKIVSQGMIGADMAHQLTETELLEFLLLPGFTTAETVTEISGRGVGLDVAQSMVQEVGGSLRLSSQPRQGTTFYLQLPLTLSVIRTLLVEVAGEPYAFPLTRIDQIHMLSRSEIAVVENHQYFMVNDQSVGLIAANQVLELPPATTASELLPVIVISDRLSRYGLVVDRFLGERSLVVRPLDSRLGKVPNISAAALMEDGTPVLIVDVEDLVRSIDNLLASGRLHHIHHGVEKSVTQAHKRILVVDDSITVREMERKLLENHGYKVEVAVNGMDGWNAVRTGHYDLIVTDIDMPRMNGIELVKQVKTHSTLKSLPVIIVSYKDREDDRIQGLEAGADYYLTKSSFHDDTLLKAVMDLIGEATT